MTSLKYLEPNNIILIGASTGGPSLIQKIISNLPQLGDVSIVIAQHMSEGFIYSFVKRLKELSKNKVDVIDDGMALLGGGIYFCNKNTRVYEARDGLKFSVDELPSTFSYNPNISNAFSSFAPLTSKKNITAFILTGIGDDGINGAKELCMSGAKIITQTQECAVVDGMPSRARENIGKIKICSTKEIEDIIMELVNNV
ncbi:MAG: CheB methylesterase domain-containing protein [Sulfurimonas sp.]|jgi:two-component system chemotaxis response regulator CheB|nr:CheB methylesterase domain-containing protein [Sulfurimonadaceae bacterium]